MHGPFKKIISNQLAIKQEQFTQEKFDSVVSKFKTEKQQMKYHQKNEKSGNSMKDCFGTVM